MGTSSEQHYSLRWNDYTVKIVTAFQSLRDEEDFVDVTVACDGHHYSAHKMVLSACSPYFRSLLRANPCQHPIVILKDVGHIEMERLLEFMYNGEVNIAQDQLAAFLKTAESLKIRGLAGTSDDLEQSQGRDIHNFSGGTGTVGISGRNSPSGGFNSSQECKDDDITTDGIFHTNSPSTKRRKRGSDAPTVSQADNSSSQTTDNLSGEGLMESSSDRVTMSGDHSIDLEDERMDSNSRRELKSEPSDSLGEVYVESSDIALAGPSGSSSSLNNQDGIPSSDNAGLPDRNEGEGALLPGSSSSTTTSSCSSYRAFHWGSPQSRLGGGGTPDNQCLVCFKSFSNRGSMTRHLRDQHLQPGATVTCDLCGKVCKNRNCLITHRSVAHSGRRRVRSFTHALSAQEVMGAPSVAEAAISKIMEMHQEMNGQPLL